MVLITEKSTRQWNKIFKSYSTSSKENAKKIVDKLRAENNYARIVCGYDKNKQRVRMYSIIFKPK